MKKVMFVLVSLLIVSTCFALESGPSNAVGYVKVACPSGGFTQFGLPFVFWDVPAGNVPTYGTESRKPSDICGSQPTAGSISSADRIVRQDGSSDYAYRRTSTTGTFWTGTLETPGPLGAMEPGRAYWYQNKSAAQVNLVLAGQVDTTAGAALALPDPIPTVLASPGYTSYSWRDSRVVPRNKLNLRTAPYGAFVGGTISTSDKVLEQATTGTSFYYRTSDNTWQGSLAGSTPGQSYWIQNKHATAWNYTYVASGTSLVTENPDTPALQRVAAPIETKAAPAVRGSSIRK